MSTANDLLVVGAGGIGQRVGKQWRALYPDATIIGETRTDEKHDLVTEAGMTPAILGSTPGKFPKVVFCAPPSGSENFGEDVLAATKRAADDGRVVFTSSGSVHGPTDFVTESTPYGTTERAQRMIRAEEAVLSFPGGVAVRLAGLYSLFRGPHVYWSRKGFVPGSAESQVNMIHYDDAALAVVCALRLEKLPERRTFLASVLNSVTRKQLFEASLRHPQLSDFKVPKIMEDEPPTRRRYDNTWSREVLGFKPKFESFVDFMETDAKRAALEAEAASSS